MQFTILKILVNKKSFTVTVNKYTYTKNDFFKFFQLKMYSQSNFYTILVGIYIVRVLGTVPDLKFQQRAKHIFL